MSGDWHQGRFDNFRFDKVLEADLKHNVVMTAAFAWFAANRDDKFPRK